MNKHELARTGELAAEWRCEVEPGDFYPAIFRGILMGTMQAQGVPEPVVELSEKRALSYGQACVFTVRWVD